MKRYLESSADKLLDLGISSPVSLHRARTVLSMSNCANSYSERSHPARSPSELSNKDLIIFIAHENLYKARTGPIQSPYVEQHPIDALARVCSKFSSPAMAAVTGVRSIKNGRND